MAPLRVGIISAAWGAYAHLPAWRAVAGAEPMAICTSRQETADAAKAEHGFAKAYGDFREMARDPDIDIVDVGTRPHLRPAMVMEALAHGKHVYAGIPFADTLAHAREMARVQQASALVGMVDAYSQWTPAIRHMRALIGSGYLGEVWGFSCRFHLQLFAEGQVNVPTYTWFAGQTTGASVLRNLGSHALNAIVAILGPVDEVIADLRRVLDAWRMADGSVLRPEVHDHATLLVKLANGVAGTVDLAWSGGDGTGFTLAAHGSNGRLEARAPHFPDPFATRLFGSQSRGYLDQAPEPVEIPADMQTMDGVAFGAAPAPPASLPMAFAMARMCARIRGETNEASPDFAQALHVQAVIDAAERSAAQRAWKTIEEPWTPDRRST